MKHQNGDKVLPGDLYVGAVLDLNCHKFVILDADEHTYRLMEKYPQTFPLSNFDRIHERLMLMAGPIKAPWLTNGLGILKNGFGKK